MNQDYDYDYAPPDIAAITREAHRMRHQAIEETVAFVLRGGKNVVVTLARHTADLARIGTAYIDRRFRHH